MFGVSTFFAFCWTTSHLLVLPDICKPEADIALLPPAVPCFSLLLKMALLFTHVTRTLKAAVSVSQVTASVKALQSSAQVCISVPALLVHL